MPEPLTAADCRVLLSLAGKAILSPDQRARIEAWLADRRDVAQTVEDCAARLCEPVPFAVCEPQFL